MRDRLTAASATADPCLSEGLSTIPAWHPFFAGAVSLASMAADRLTRARLPRVHACIADALRRTCQRDVQIERLSLLSLFGLLCFGRRRRCLISARRDSSDTTFGFETLRCLDHMRLLSPMCCRHRRLWMVLMDACLTCWLHRSAGVQFDGHTRPHRHRRIVVGRHLDFALPAFLHSVSTLFGHLRPSPPRMANRKCEGSPSSDAARR